MNCTMVILVHEWNMDTHGTVAAIVGRLKGLETSRQSFQLKTLEENYLV